VENIVENLEFWAGVVVPVIIVSAVIAATIFALRVSE
jgi:hypothetical protein